MKTKLYDFLREQFNFNPPNGTFPFADCQVQYLTLRKVKIVADFLEISFYDLLYLIEKEHII